ncbi:MAG TPA: superoxide dismutase family protein [Humisphaera sp.]
MRTIRLVMAGAIGLSMAAYAATAADKPAEKPAAAHDPAEHKAGAHAGATATIAGAGEHKDKIKGMLTFTEAHGGVRVTGEITGLTPGKHGFHVHEKGDLSDPKLVSAGGHFNPGKSKHGGPDTEHRHAGDWGNITADDKGVAKIDATFKGVSLTGKEDGIVGRSVIVHAKEDDTKTDPSGASGDRIAGGVIEAAKAAEKK